MDNAEEKVPETVISALMRSGFPFQTAVAQAIIDAPPWKVHQSEYPWLTADGNEKFLDIVATNGSLYLTVECKKTQKEKLIFLRPLVISHTGVNPRFRCLRAEQTLGHKFPLRIFNEEWALYPTSTDSEFCVVSTSESGRDQRLLERDASLLVRATDAFAHDFRERFKPDSDSPPSPECLFVPVIVTNAPIYTARYSPRDVSLETGEFSKPPREIEEAKSVRFRKAFTSDGGPDLGDRSVFVVHAQSFAAFLGNIGVAPDQLQPQDRSRAFFPRLPQYRTEERRAR